MSTCNDCVPVAISSLTGMPRKKVAQIVKTTNQGTYTKNGTSKSAQKKLGITYVEAKRPKYVTATQLISEAKLHKGGAAFRIGDPYKQISGTHVIHINQKGQLTGREKKHSKDGVYILLGAALKTK